jgi:hypothetical protein
MEKAFDEFRSVFIVLQWKLISYFLFKIPKRIQLKALKYVSCVRRENGHFHPVLCERLQCFRLDMNGIIVPEQNSFFIGEFFIRPQFVDVWKEKR